MTTATAPTPKTLQGRRLTLAEAADQWEKSMAEIRRQEGLRDQAKARLLEYFDRTGRASYKGRIGWQWKGGQTIWDGDKLRAFLGAKVTEFQTQAKRSRSLVLLGKG